MFNNNCFIFLKFNFYIIKFNSIYNVNTFAFFYYNIKYFNHFNFFNDKIIINIE